MADIETWRAFMGNLRQRQEMLRGEREPYTSGGMRILRGVTGGEMRDITDKRIDEINGEIASLQKTIDMVISTQGLDDA